MTTLQFSRDGTRFATGIGRRRGHPVGHRHRRRGGSVPWPLRHGEGAGLLSRRRDAVHRLAGPLVARLGPRRLPTLRRQAPSARDPGQRRLRDRHPQRRADHLRQWSQRPARRDAVPRPHRQRDEPARSRSATAASETFGYDRRTYDQVATTGRDGFVRIWERSTGRLISEREVDGQQARLQRRRRTDPRRRRRRRGLPSSTPTPSNRSRRRSSSTTASSAFTPAPTTAPRSP